MNLRIPVIAVLLGALCAGGCTCDGGTKKIKPSLQTAPTQLNFGKVKVGGSAQLAVTLSVVTNAAASITQVTLEDGNAPGGASAFTVIDAPQTVPALGDASFKVGFAPTAMQAYEAKLVIASNDEDHPEIVIPISGEGQEPILSVTPDCLPSRNCKATVTLEPPAIDFGAEPFQRAVQLPSTELPSVTLVNESEVELLITRIAIEGADAAAFTFDNNPPLPGAGTEPLRFDGGTGASLSIRFKPQSEQQTDYSAQMVIESDDPAHAQVTVELKGKLGPNQAPTVCANIVRVQPAGEQEFRYDTQADWAPLLVPPAGGYDFTQSRDIRPKSDVRFSALSDSADDRACTSDPEDRRVGLTYQWTVLKTPPDARNVVLSAATTAAPTLPANSTLATGEYEVGLTVKDAQGHATSTTLKFAVVRKEDLVVQLSWNQDDLAFADTDLDLHLVRPSSAQAADPFSGAFSYFEEGPNQKTSGDMNGYAWGIYQAQSAQGLNFDWGGIGTADDPRLNLDDKGGGALIENISLNYPERDAECAQADCTYKVFVHYFEDKRSHTAPPPCTVSGSGACVDGAVCDCTAQGDRCVADTAPKSAAATGTGKCYRAPQPVVKIFFKANPVPAAVIPLDTLNPPDELAVGAPCQMLYVADIVWPKQTAGMDAGTPPPPQVVVRGADADGRITAPEVSRFGMRASGSLKCGPNVPRGSSSLDNWYAWEPL